MNSVNKLRISRRAMLRGTGVALALPWLDSMQPALSAEVQQPKRFLGVLNYFSFHTPLLFPSEAGFDYTPSPYLELLQAHRRDFTIISGLNHPDVRDGHASDKSFFTGAPHPNSSSFRNTISVDQLAAEILGQETRYASLNFSTSPAYSCSYNRHGVALPPETSPARAFTNLFVNGSAAEVREEVARIQEGQSILDRIAGSAIKLRKSVGPADKHKLDQYFTSVRELENRLVRAEEFARQPKPTVDVPPIEDPGPGEDITRFGLLLEVAQLAMQCDLTRIVTMYYVGSSKAPSQPGTSFAYHNLSHHGLDSDKIEQLAILERDLLRQWDRYLHRMTEAKTAGSSLMADTLSVMGAAMGNASSHSATNLPILVAGGALKHGQHLAHDLDNPPPLCNLWVTALQHLGIEADQFGSGSSTLTGMS